jgi:hypothetical protein
MQIQTELVDLEVGGRRAQAVVLVIAEDAPPELREAIARRRLLQTEGKCPCGAELTGPECLTVALHRLRHSGLDVATVAIGARHKPDCPATDKNLHYLLNKYGVTIAYAGGERR